MRVYAGAVVGLLVSLVGHANAQVNIEPFRNRIKLNGYSLLLQGTFDGHTGNTQGVTADGLAGAGAASGPHLVFAFGSIDYSRLNGTLGVDKSFAHGRYDYQMMSWSWWEVFAQEQSDVFQRIKTRTLFGTGPRFALYETPYFALFFGIAYMFERDVIDAAPGSSDEPVLLANRISTYLTAHATLSDGIDAVTTTYAQPRVDDPSDIRILSESGFVFKVTKRLSTSISFTAHYDTNHPTGVRPADTELKNAIALTL